MPEAKVIYRTLDEYGQEKFLGTEALLDTTWVVDRVTVSPNTEPGATADDLTIWLRPAKCTCWPTDPSTWEDVTGFGNYDPASQFEQNPDCEVHHA